MKNDTKIPDCGPVPDFTGCRLKVGSKQIRKALLSGRTKVLYLALDADPAVTEPAAALAQRLGIRTNYVSSMKALGRACAIEVGASAAAVVDED